MNIILIISILLKVSLFTTKIPLFKKPFYVGYFLWTSIFYILIIGIIVYLIFLKLNLKYSIFYHNIKIKKIKNKKQILML